MRLFLITIKAMPKHGVLSRRELQMPYGQKLKAVFGYDRGNVGWYRDLALGLISGLALMFGFIFASERFSGRGSSFDTKIALGCFTVILLCIVFSPNKRLILIGTLATPAAFALLKFFSSGNLAALAIALGMFVLIAVLGGVDGFVQWHRRRRRSS